MRIALIHIGINFISAQSAELAAVSLLYSNQNFQVSNNCVNHKIEYTVATIRKLPQLANLLKKEHFRVIEETVDDALLMVTVKVNAFSDESKKIAIKTVQDLFGKSIKEIQES